MVQQCIIQPNAQLYAGEVIGTYDVPPFGKGKIRDLGLTVQGKTKKTVRITITKNYVKLHNNWKDARAYINKTTK